MKIAVAIFICLGFLVPSVTHASVRYGDTGPEVKIVQEHLKWYGYSVKTDGVFGPQTLKAVKKWQKANGLEEDGVVGPITGESLGIRLGSLQVTVPPSPPEPPGGLSRCDEMSWYRQQAGLPEIFDSIGWRESNCKNDAPPTLAAAACCRGWWAIHRSNIRAPGYSSGAKACGITTESDYYGTSVEQKKASACFAKVLYDVSGMTPWAV